ncbi:MAG: aminoglycoside phosphotransferase family protein, partial [Acidimicrobiia bacterium]|nr:aminoglycoside phosphotransferase family protein [Acidimicrobiia bacterium]
MARQGIRSAWSEVPPSVRDAVDALVGSPVLDVRATTGGFSPGPAVRAGLADGRTVFVKAAGSSLNEQSPLMHRREGEVLEVLPHSVPAPRLLGVVDDGDWVALVIEWVDGRMPVAADPADVRRLLDLLCRVAAPTPPAGQRGRSPFGETNRGRLGPRPHIGGHPAPG